MDDRTETLIRSLKRSGAEYSEIFIKGPETEAIGRLVLYPLSATIFSSDPNTYAAIQALEARGMPLAEALAAAPRLLLHACALGFVHPVSGLPLQFDNMKS